VCGWKSKMIWYDLTEKKQVKKASLLRTEYKIVLMVSDV
jgi:hypothetical protein